MNEAAFHQRFHIATFNMIDTNKVFQDLKLKFSTRLIVGLMSENGRITRNADRVKKNGDKRRRNREMLESRRLFSSGLNKFRSSEALDE